MELTQPKPHFPLGLYRILGNIAVPILGIIALMIVALQLWRTADGFQRFALVPVGLGIAVIGLAYYRIRRVLGQLDGEIDGVALAGLLVFSNAMAISGYVICILSLGHYR
jgi:hypothetical protein